MSVMVMKLAGGVLLAILVSGCESGHHYHRHRHPVRPPRVTGDLPTADAIGSKVQEAENVREVNRWI